MKWRLAVMLTVALGIVFATYSECLSYYRDSHTSKKAETPKAYESIETIKGEPSRPYVKIGLVWEMHRKAEKAVLKLKKRAHKMEADAVIHYVIQAPAVFGWTVRWTTSEEARQVRESDDMPVIFGKPRRPYRELGPVWYSHSKINKALEKLKKLARKKGADAIIEFKIGSYEGVAYSNMRQSFPAHWKTSGLIAWNTWSSTSSNPWQGPTGGDIMFDPQPQQPKTDAPTQFLTPRHYTIPMLQGIAVEWTD